MKNKKIIYFGLMFLPLLIILIALPFMPEKIPAHYDFEGQITRWGSKYEALIYPGFTLLMGYYFLAMSKIASKQEENGKNNEKIVFYTGMGLSVFFTVEHCYFLYKDFAAAKSMSFSGTGDVNQLICILLGISLVIMGNFMPKLRNNSIIGLRTSWSTKNDITWKKSQIFGGISFIIGGALMIIAGIFMEGYTAMCVALGIIIICTIAGTIYSYIAAKKY